jgi:glucokinase
MTRSAPVVLAVDLGGTWLRVAHVDGAGRILARARISTPAGGDPEAVIPAIARLAASLARPAPGTTSRATGVAAPGPLDPETGVVYATPNLAGWENVPLAERLGQALHQPVWLHNDANLAALGEARYGAGRGFDPLVYLTISTGVGGGIISGGRIFAGAHGLAGELGHVIVRAGGPACNFGHPGCLEALASGPALARQAERRLAAGEDSSLAARRRAGHALTGLDVARAAAAGDALAREVLRELGETLGLAIGSFINGFDPARVVLGGGVSRSWDAFEPAMLAAVRQVAMALPQRHVDIVPAQLGDDGGLLGAAAYAWSRLTEHA